MSEQVFEMFWDCEFCGTLALLGKTNRYCPQCGAPQNPDKRYFPPPGKEVAANHEYEGVDKTCPACATPNGAKSNNCRHCGSPLDGSAEVKRVEDRLPGAAPQAMRSAVPPMKAPPKKNTPWLVIALVAVGVLVSCCLVGALWKKDASVTVTGHRWERTIGVEALGPVSESAWCDSVPSGASGIRRHREQRSTRRIEDGQTCTSRDVDRGDGTFVRKQDCRPRYREEPVYDEKCDYVVERWKTVRTEKASGTNLQPQWPAVSLSGGERRGGEGQSYVLELKLGDGAADTCSKDEAAWARFTDGKTYPAKQRMIGNSVDCDSLQP